MCSPFYKYEFSEGKKLGTFCSRIGVDGGDSGEIDGSSKLRSNLEKNK
jgi:hypothetical protein